MWTLINFFMSSGTNMMTLNNFLGQQAGWVTLKQC